MVSESFDSLTRQAAAGGKVPGALAFLNAPGVAALTRQVEAAGKKRGGKKTRRKQKGQACPPAVDRCAPQDDSCFTLLTALCGGQSECLSKIVCCSALSTCDATGFFDCLLA